MRTALAVLGLAVLLSVSCWGQAISFTRPDDLQGWVPEFGQWSLNDEGLLQSDAGLPRTITWLPTKAWADVDVTVEFKIHDVGEGVRSPGLVYRAENAQSYYYVHIDQKNQQIVWVRSTPDNEWADARRHRPFDLASDKWHTLRIMATGEYHDVYLNGQLIFTEQDDTIKGGIIGLRTGQGRIGFRNLSVTGTDYQLEKPFKIYRAPFFSVCTDAGAGAYEAFPDVCRTKSGQLLCVFYAGYGHVSVPTPNLPKGARISMVRSDDDGETWSPAEVVVDSDIDDRDASITELSDGQLLVTYMSYDPGRRPGTHQIFIVRSGDGGKTWGEPERVPTELNGNEAVSEPIREMPDGTLLLAVYGELSPPWPTTYVCEMLESKDKGVTWQTISRIESEKYMLCEPSIARFPDGRLLMLIRPTMTWCESADGGKTWTEPVPVGIAGDAPYLLLTSKNVLLCGYRDRSSHSTKVMASQDFGKTWQEPVLVDKVLGAYPSMAELPDGRILFVYYTEGPGSDIRGVHLSADETGVRVIPRESD